MTIHHKFTIAFKFENCYALWVCERFDEIKVNKIGFRLIKLNFFCFRKKGNRGNSEFCVTLATQQALYGRYCSLCCSNRFYTVLHILYFNNFFTLFFKLFLIHLFNIFISCLIIFSTERDKFLNSINLL